MKPTKKDFDCVEMKNQIQAKIYEEIKENTPLITSRSSID
jgi:hypothetical protein